MQGLTTRALAHELQAVPMAVSRHDEADLASQVLATSALFLDEEECAAAHRTGPRATSSDDLLGCTRSSIWLAV
jgi:hypothetical protein